MEKIKLTFIVNLILICGCSSCGYKVNLKDLADAENKILQQDDGSILLKLEKATCYSDLVTPSSNTAEWKIVVSKPGRFKVWLSSATKDTTVLSYSNTVRINLLDNHLEGNPRCDKIVKNSDDVAYPYFRTDSYMGSLFFLEPGEYNIQIISEKAGSKAISTRDNSLSDDTRLMSVILIPMTR